MLEKKGMQELQGHAEAAAELGREAGFPPNHAGSDLRGHSKPYEHAPGARGTVAD